MVEAFAIDLYIVPLLLLFILIALLVNIRAHYQMQRFLEQQKAPTQERQFRQRI